MNDYEFSNDWFQSNPRHVWDSLIPQINPRKILEVGSYEGASACYLIEKLGNAQALEVHCIDSWEGGIEHQSDGTNMGAVESRFQRNIQRAIQSVSNPVDLHVQKSYSDLALARLLAEGKRNYFDFVYIDGSHQAPDVLCDAVLGFRLLRQGGVIAFDDYVWFENLSTGKDPLRCPKPAIDAFTNLYFRKLNILRAPLYQLYLQKTSDD